MSRSSFPSIMLNTKFSLIDTKPRAKRASRRQDSHRNCCPPSAAEETQIQNQPLRPALQSDFCPGRQSRVFMRSGNTWFKGSLHLKHWGGSHWKSTSQACAAERFRSWPSIQGVCAVQKHKSARGKVLLMLKYLCCKAEQRIEISASIFSHPR